MTWTESTPGPWTWRMSCSSNGHETLNSVDGPIGIMRLVSNRSAENEANARLIAAVPDLLAAAEKIEPLMVAVLELIGKKSVLTADTYRALDALSDAIKKAKGE